jgi:hypothetical protein
VLRALAVALSISADELLFGEPRGPAAGALSVALEAAEQLDRDEQAAVVLVIEGLTARAAAVRTNTKPRRR